MVKISVEHGDFATNEILLRCRTLDEEMLEILTLLQSRSARIPASLEGEIHMLSPGEVLYAESVEERIFLYTSDSVFESKSSLAGLESRHLESGFFRIGKSQLVNLYQVKQLKSLPNSRIGITLQNGEKLIASRHYAQRLKEKLGLLE